MSEATAKNISRLIELTGITHKELGDIAGVSRSAVTHWVSGQSEPRMGPIQRISDYYGISKSSIIDTDGMRSVYMSPRTGKLYDTRGSEADAYRDAYEHRMEFGEALGDILKRREVSASELAGRIHTNVSYVESIIDCDNHDVSVARAFQIADALEIPLSQIIEYIDGTDLIDSPEDERRKRDRPFDMDMFLGALYDYMQSKPQDDTNET